MTTVSDAPAGLTPELFAPQAITGETQQFNEQLAQLLAQMPPLEAQAPAAIRAARDSGESWMGQVVRLDHAEERTIPGPGGDIALRVLTPETVDGVYFHIHGGGWTLGAADQQDPALWATAQAANVAVVSVEYRLAPEHPYPAGPDDCEAAAVWLTEHAQSEFGTDRIVIGGESAGGHLSAVTLLRMRDRHGFTGFAGANLVYGAYDLSMTPSQVGGEEALIIPGAVMRMFYEYFLPSDDARDPDVSPLYADLRGMPPALFTVGTLDPLLDDSLFMHQRWLAAGNPSELAVYPGGTHAFNAFPIEIGRQANERMHDFIRDAVAPAD